MYTVVLDHAAAPPQLPPLDGLLVGALLILTFITIRHSEMQTDGAQGVHVG